MTSRPATPACSTNGATAGMPAAPWAMPSTASSRSLTATAPACSPTWRFRGCRRPTTTWSSSSAPSATMSGAPPAARRLGPLRPNLAKPGRARLRPRPRRDADPPRPDQRPGSGGGRSGQTARNPRSVETAPPRQGPALPLPPQSGGIPRRTRTTSLPTASFAALVFLDGSRISLVPGDDVDLVGLDFAIQYRFGDFGDETFTKMRRHVVDVIVVQAQLPGDLLVR